MNLLKYLDNHLLIDDEAQRVMRTEIRGLVRELESTCNGFGFRPETVYEEFRDDIKELPEAKWETATRYAERTLYRIALQWIWFYGTLPKQTPKLPPDKTGIFIDPNNQRAVPRCQVACRDPEFQKELALYGMYNYSERKTWSDDLYETAYRFLLTEVNGNMHGACVQTATTLMLYAVRNLKLAEVRKTYGDTYWRM